uniref:long-chain-fatty-acid--CoA ligase n=2 Tax=Canis lupus familiaris TaxID=9615 RepID=A0A8I3NEK9_CANLF
MASSSTMKNGLSRSQKAKSPMTREENVTDSQINMNKNKVTPRLWTIHRDGEVLLRLSKHGPGHETPLTIPEFFRESVSRFGMYPALATKNSEHWEVLNFNQYYEACRKAARALIKLGLQRFHGVGILGFNSVEWLIASLGAILAGGLCVGIYATNSADACQYVITNAKVNVLLVENDLQLQKILSIPQSRMETLKAIIQYKLPVKESNNNLYSWNDFMELGNSIPDSQLDQIIESQRANQCAVIIYTSGTLGNPKGVMLSHDNGEKADLGLPGGGRLVARGRHHGICDLNVQSWAALVAQRFSWRPGIESHVGLPAWSLLLPLPVSLPLSRSL